ncbi:hypothetical protein GCM10027162_08110 [Streptomyces incanus]
MEPRPGRQRGWTYLLVRMDDVLPGRVKEQATARIVMLTHNQQLHEADLGRRPRAEDLLWQPAAQETKRSENGALDVRYAREVKLDALTRLRELSAAHAPRLRIRYAF